MCRLSVEMVYFLHFFFALISSLAIMTTAVTAICFQGMVSGSFSVDGFILKIVNRKIPAQRVKNGLNRTVVFLSHGNSLKILVKLYAQS